MKKFITILFMLTSFVSFSQVGISTNSSFTPTSTLDVDGVINAMTSYKINNSVGTAGNFLRSNGTTGFVASNIQVSDVPTLNQNTTGSAGSLLNSLTLNNGGSGAVSGTLFDGSSAVTISYNTIGGWGLLGNSATAGTNFIGTTNNSGLSFRTNNIEQMRLQSSGQLTIGATTAGAKLDVHQTTGTAVGRFTTYGNTNDIELRRSNGTQVSPTATTGAGTVLGRLFAQGYNGSGYTSAASISMETDAAGGTSTDMPGAIVFNTTLDGTGTLSERMRISNSGNVGIGTVTPSEKLDVSGNVKLTATTTATSTNGQLRFTAGGEGTTTKMVVFRKTTSLTTSSTSVTKIFDDGYMRFGVWFNSTSSRWVVGFSPYNNQFYDYNYLGNAGYYNGSYYYTSDGVNNYVWGLSDDISTTSGTYYECGGVLNTANWNYATGGSGMIYSEGTTTTNPFYEFNFFVSYTSTSTQRLVTVIVKAYY